MTWLIGAALVAAAAAVVILAQYPTFFNAGPTPFPLPSGAISLAIRKQPPLPPGFVQGCLLEFDPYRLVMQWNKDSHVVTFTGGSWQSATDVEIAWPAGFSVREYQGRAELVTPNGRVLARDGEVVPGVTGPYPASICVSYDRG